MRERFNTMQRMNLIGGDVERTETVYTFEVIERLKIVAFKRPMGVKE